jgi:hypothetical protein
MIIKMRKFKSVYKNPFWWGVWIVLGFIGCGVITENSNITTDIPLALIPIGVCVLFILLIVYTTY